MNCKVWNVCRQRRKTLCFCCTTVYIQQVGDATCMLLCFSMPCILSNWSANSTALEEELQYFHGHMQTLAFWGLLKPLKYLRRPSEAKIIANPCYIHGFKQHVSHIDYTFNKNNPPKTFCKYSFCHIVTSYHVTDMEWKLIISVNQANWQY